MIGRADGTGAMFDRIADRYDLINKVMTAGVDRWWRHRLARALVLPPRAGVLDVATGTGDLALAVARCHPDASISAIDPSPRMLQRARAKLAAIRTATASEIAFHAGVAESLPFADCQFDAVCIGFGIRNVADRPRALAEMVRVIRPRGAIAVLEVSEPSNAAARFYVHRVIPWLGAAIARGDEYRYFERSIARFPAPAAFVRMMEQAGARDVHVIELAFGACHIYLAGRI